MRLNHIGGNLLIMKKKCQNCGKKIESGAKFCAYCGKRSCAVNIVAALSSNRKKRSLCCFGIIAVFVILIVLFNANMLLPWQYGARLNKQAILGYASENYPDAKVLEQHYNTLTFNLLKSASDDYIIFKQDSLEFGIFARGGKITIDDYPRIRANSQFDKIIQDGFFKPRGIDVQTQYHFSDDYYKLYPYTGGLGVTLRIYDQGSTPQELGWIYDFYKYWRDNATFLKSYSISIEIVVNQDYHEIMYNDTDIFFSEDELYGLFK